jgi:2-haloacid dehalogenase
METDQRRAPTAVVFDVNETLFPLTPVRDRMARAGLTPQRLEPWFRGVLVDGMAAALTGGMTAFAELARHHLEVELAAAGIETDAATVGDVLAGFDEVVPHPDVLPALEVLDTAGIETALLTNGSSSIAESFLERAGLRPLVGEVWDVGAAGHWKPHRAAYDWAIAQLGATPGEVVMVAVHPWDVHGAMSAGLVGAWVDRPGLDRYPPGFHPPDHVARSLRTLVDDLIP